MRRVATALALIALAAATALAGVDSGGSHTLAAAQTTTDYDDDDDRLIDVRTLAQLNAIRWDLNGDGDVSATDAANYLLAFPNRDANAATRMGCPSTTTGNACRGYELRADLDFDTDGDGDVDAQDSPSFPDWTPIGAANNWFAAEFNGNNKTISNMKITSRSEAVGLFGASSGVISKVGIVDASITVGGTNGVNIGALTGRNIGTIRSSYATGSISYTGSASFNFIGGLVGLNRINNTSVIAASWTDVDISAGSSFIYAGGLVGRLTGGTITAAYAAGAVSLTGSNSRAGGLVGSRASRNASITASYATGPISATGSNSTASGITGGETRNLSPSLYWDAGTTGVSGGRTTSDLQSITSYTGIFANWNVNVDGQTGVEDPWEFGTAMQYPRLQFGFDAGGQVAQGSLVMGTPGTNGDNPFVGQTARVCLLDGPTQRAAGTGGRTYAPWQWYRSTDGISWGNPITKTGPTYDYMPVSGDVGNYLRACVDVVSTTGAERVLGADRVCVGPFAKVQASGGS